MSDLLKKLEKITLEAKNWKFYGVITPIFFILILFAFHLMTGHTAAVMFGGWVLFIVTCLVWWVWTIRIFVALAESHTQIHTTLNEVVDDVGLVKEDVKNLRIDTRQSK